MSKPSDNTSPNPAPPSLPQALQGVRVLDLSRILAGPWCTQMLGDMGADVIKIERPHTGDDTRRWGPPYLADDRGEPTHESAYFLCTNRNKRSVECDIATPAGQALIRALIAQSHVLIENFKVGDMARYGLDYESLKAINPALVYCAITGFGQDGPAAHQAGYDFAIQGQGGLMSITGEPDNQGGQPLKVGVAVVDLMTGLYASNAVLAALRHAERTGEGQFIDMALLDTQVAMLANVGANYLVHGQYHQQIPSRLGNAHPNIVPYQAFEVKPAPDSPHTSDHLILAIGNDHQFAKFCELAGCTALEQDERFATNATRVQHRQTLVPLLQSVLLKRTKLEWLQLLQVAQVPCAPINRIDQVFADPQVMHRQMVQTWVHPANDSLQLAASPIKMDRTPVQQKLAPPLLGQHTLEVLQTVWGHSPETIETYLHQHQLSRAD